MKRWLLSGLFAGILSLLPLLSTAASPEEKQTNLVHTVVEQLVGISPLQGATIGIYVVDAANGEVLANVKGEQAMKPASCNKLLTTAAGLSLLGPQHTLQTDLLYTGTVQGGVLKGDLVVKGGGDPSISGRFQQNKKDVTFTLRKWAEDLKTSGIREIHGNIIADDTCFDREYFHPTWYPAERGEWYEAEVSGLAFNDNCVDLTWCANDRLPSQSAQVTLNPPTCYVQLNNQVQVAARGRSAGREYLRADGSNDIVATGTLSVDTTKEDSASVSNGPLYFATVFQEVLTSAGIEVSGQPLLVEPAKAPQLLKRARLVSRHVSPPLSELVKIINLNSQNFYADSLVKNIGRIQRGSGSFAAGTQAVKEFCRNSGIYHQGHEMVDGSGLSAKNNVSARQLVELIRFMDKGSLREHWRASLPVGGTRGSLKTRFQQTNESRTLAPRILGKTGLIGGVRSLSGIVQGQSGRQLYYSIILNDLRGSSSEKALDFIDSIAVALAKVG